MNSRAHQNISQQKIAQTIYQKILCAPSWVRFVLAALALLLGSMPGSGLAATLSSIAVTPANPTINIGQTQQFTATGTFSDGSNHALTSADSTWVNKAPMTTARRWYGVGVVNDILYAVGGYSNSTLATMEAYDPLTNTWATKPPMPTARYGLAVGVVNGILYAVGGVDSSGAILATVEAYDPATNIWVTKAPMSTPRYYPAVGIVNGLVYAIGGLSSSSSDLATVEAYDPVTNTWTPKASMPTPRVGLAVGVMNGTLYAVGGRLGSSILSTVEAYDPVTDTWMTKSSLPTVRLVHAVGVVNGMLYAVGGGNDNTVSVSSVLATVDAYNPVTDTWTPTSPMSTPRYGLAVGVVNATLYAVGGGDSSAISLATMEAYTGIIWTSSNPSIATIDADGLASGLSSGTTTITATYGDISNSTTLLVVSPNSPPIACAGPDQTIEATGPAGTTVNLDGSCSTDPDGDALSYIWSGPFGSISGMNLTVTLPLGTHTITLTVSDGSVSASDSMVIVVQDTTPPIINPHTDVTVEATSAAGAVVSYISPITTDTVDGAGVATCLPASGSTFSLGDTTVTCNATDAHGNAATATTFVVHVVDTTSPVISASQSPLANANGWNNSDVTVSFSATDAVSTPTCTVNSVTLTTDAAGQEVSTTCTDAAGNSATANHTVNIDKTAPVVIATRTPAANADGWNNTDVSAHFTATDGLSGVEGGIAADVVIAGEGMGQTASYSFTDKAGNSSSATVSNINIDKTAPVLTLPSLAGSYGLNSSITLTFAAADALSNIATQSATLNGNPVSSGSTIVLTQLGTNTFVLTATDHAGNSMTETRQFTVNYTFGGFLSPLGNNRTTFHLGSTIPVKFELFDANGAAITTAVASLSLQKLSNGDPVGDPIDATPTSGADSGNQFRYSGGHYMYNLSTKPFTAGTWRIQATLNDGTVQTIEIGLSSK